MQIKLSDILRVIKFIRPKFYNKLTWLMVVSGLSLMSAPLWISLVNQFLDKKFSFSFSNGSDIAWGFSLCVVALLYNLINTGIHELLIKKLTKEDGVKVIEHDLNVYSKLDEFMSEELLERTIAHLETSDAIYWDDFSAIEVFVRTADSASNAFYTEKLKEKTMSLVESLNELKGIVNNDFDEYPYTQTVTNFRMCLAPQLNCDRAGNWEDRQAYTALTDRMMVVTGRMNSDYEQWRLAIKSVLYV
ncbi:hypothetical protein [Gilvimarinus sp. 1_MG-2023]|uniref:hypothetical protein n=1 Tax=Gilvimarinus sp. 1_MG-2023 TaxID=3062638 RepID=UPI0026E1E922|nr:hypothetical protein [Gilvimarinus sp. 1_MG-2023]MDO6747076.1 hypothetical protein [Gilvimarinus sp. 1_MG-2023]